MQGRIDGDRARGGSLGLGQALLVAVQRGQHGVDAGENGVIGMQGALGNVARRQRLAFGFVMAAQSGQRRGASDP